MSQWYTEREPTAVIPMDRSGSHTLIRSRTSTTKATGWCQMIRWQAIFFLWLALGPPQEGRRYIFMLRANPARRPLGFQGMKHPLKSFYSSLSLCLIPSLRPPTPLGHHRRPASRRWWLSMPAQWVVALLLPLGTGSYTAVRSWTGSFSFVGKGGATIAEF